MRGGQRALHFENHARSEKDIKQNKIARDAIKIQRNGEISRQTRLSSYPTCSGRTQLLACFRNKSSPRGLRSIRAGYDSGAKVRCKRRHVPRRHAGSTPSDIEMAERYQTMTASASRIAARMQACVQAANSKAICKMPLMRRPYQSTVNRFPSDQDPRRRMR